MGATSTRPKDDLRVNAARPVSSDVGPTAHSAKLRKLRVPRRPRIWFELSLIAVSYGIYSIIRNAVPEQVAQAQRNARWIWSVQENIGLAFEQSLNHALSGVTWLIVSMNYYYATLHFVVTIAVLVWLFRHHPGRYGAARLALFVATGSALLGYYFYPLAPPRLMHGVHFVDTVKVHDTWGAMSSESMAQVSNQYAAMPSMHAGWSLWCGLTLLVLARPLWVKALGVLYPSLTLVVIVATANHFWLDAVGGVVCLAFGYLLAWLWYGRPCYLLPRRVPVPTSARFGPSGRNGPNGRSGPDGPGRPAGSTAQPS
jgi:hypothetical protein